MVTTDTGTVVTDMVVRGTLSSTEVIGLDPFTRYRVTVLGNTTERGEEGGPVDVVTAEGGKREGGKREGGRERERERERRKCEWSSLYNMYFF